MSNSPANPQTPASASLQYRSQVQAAVASLLDAWKSKVEFPKTGAHSRHLTVSLFRLGIRMAALNGVRPDMLLAMFQKALADELFSIAQEAVQAASGQQAVEIRDAAVKAATEAFQTAKTPTGEEPAAPTTPENYADAALADAHADDATPDDGAADGKF